MRIKAAIVERQRREGRLPDLPTIRERLNRLHDADYCLSEAHQADLWRGAVDQGDSALVDFAAMFVKKGAQLGIPLVAERFTVTTVEILHAQWRYCLPAADWGVLAFIGYQCAKRLACPTLWGPDKYSIRAGVVGVDPLDNPARWYYTGPSLLWRQGDGTS